MASTPPSGPQNEKKAEAPETHFCQVALDELAEIVWRRNQDGPPNRGQFEATAATAAPSGEEKLLENYAKAFARKLAAHVRTAKLEKSPPAGAQAKGSGGEHHPGLESALRKGDADTSEAEVAKEAVT